MKKIYDYVTWPPYEEMNKVVEDLENFYKEGWEIVSHAQGGFGISVILKRRNEK